MGYCIYDLFHDCVMSSRERSLPDDEGNREDFFDLDQFTTALKNNIHTVSELKVYSLIMHIINALAIESGEDEIVLLKDMLADYYSWNGQVKEVSINVKGYDFSKNAFFKDQE